MNRHREKRKAKKRSPATAGPSAATLLAHQRAVAEKVRGFAEPLCRGAGIELVHVEYQREPGGVTLRVYMDKPGGVTLDDCVEISRQLEDVLDVHAGDLPPYRLEVSSPGIDRPVGTLTDFVRFVGLQAKIRVATAVNGRKNFTGVLAGVVDETVQVQVGSEMVNLDFHDITRARLINYNGEH